MAQQAERKPEPQIDPSEKKDELTFDQLKGEQESQPEVRPEVKLQPDTLSTIDPSKKKDELTLDQQLGRRLDELKLWHDSIKQIIALHAATLAGVGVFWKDAGSTDKRFLGISVLVFLVSGWVAALLLPAVNELTRDCVNDCISPKGLSTGQGFLERVGFMKGLRKILMGIMTFYILGVVFLLKALGFLSGL